MESYERSAVVEGPQTLRMVSETKHPHITRSYSPSDTDLSSTSGYSLAPSGISTPSSDAGMSIPYVHALSPIARSPVFRQK